MDIVERLRAASDRLCHAAELSPGDFMLHDVNVLDEAAALIEHQAAEIDALKHDIGRARETGNEFAALIEEARSVLSRLEPHLDAIVCYASAMDEHEPNRIAFDARTLYAKLNSGKGE